MAVKLQVYVSDEVAAQIDAARGLATRSTWCKHQIETALGNAPRTPEVVGEKASAKRRMPKLRSGGGGGRED